MEIMNSIDKRNMKKAWERFCSKGVANKEAAHILQVGMRDYLNQFCRKYLGEEGIGEAVKLVLGSNGEGKSHFLYCIREEALRNGHLVAMLEAKSAGAAESPFLFGREVLSKMEVPSEGASASEESDQNPLVQLLKSAVAKKRQEILTMGLESEDLIEEWAEGIRLQNLQPFGMAQALSEGLTAAYRGDNEGMLNAISNLFMTNTRLTKTQQQTYGANLLKSIVKLPRLLGYRSLVLLIDEAELAIEQAGRARRAAFLAFLRFINDHMAWENGDSAIVFVACTDDFWPEQFVHYSALYSRLSDPGYDSQESRQNLSMKALVNKNKFWIREIFHGIREEYQKLGEEMLTIGKLVLEEMDVEIQRENVAALAAVASSQNLNPWIKRPFVKALSQTIQDQVDDEKQYILEQEQAYSKFEVAIEDIEQLDSQEVEE